MFKVKAYLIILSFTYLFISEINAQIDYTYFSNQVNKHGVSSTLEYHYDKIRSINKETSVEKRKYLKSYFNKEGQIIKKIFFDDENRPIKEKMYTYSEGKLITKQELVLKNKTIKKSLEYVYKSDSLKVSTLNTINKNIEADYYFDEKARIKKIINYNNSTTMEYSYFIDGYTTKQFNLHWRNKGVVISFYNTNKQLLKREIHNYFPIKELSTKRYSYLKIDNEKEYKTFINDGDSITRTLITETKFNNENLVALEESYFMGDKKATCKEFEYEYFE